MLDYLQMKKWLTTLFALFAVAGCLGLPGFSTVPSDKTSEQAKPEEKPFAIKVDVNLVVLNVTVLDEKGINVTTLKREDFAVYEDDTEQEIANFFPVEAPFHLVLALDNSSSTRTSLSLIKNAALNFGMNSARGPDRAHRDQFFRSLVSKLHQQPQNAGQSPAESRVCILLAARKSTTGLRSGSKQLRPVETGRKAIVILSDGMENSSKFKFEDLRRSLAQGDAVLYPVTVLNKDRQKTCWKRTSGRQRRMTRTWMARARAFQCWRRSIRFRPNGCKRFRRRRVEESTWWATWPTWPASIPRWLTNCGTRLAYLLLQEPVERWRHAENSRRSERPSLPRPQSNHLLCAESRVGEKLAVRGSK